MRAFLVALLLLPLAGCVAEPEPIDAADSVGPVINVVPVEAWKPTWGALDAAALRPGAASPGCTFDWVFVDPAAEAYFVGIAAHCTGSDNGPDGTGMRMRLYDGPEIGTIVFDSDNRTLHRDFEIEDRVDFALIQLDEGVNLQTHPQAIGYASPTGFVDCNETKVGDRIGWSGYGMVFGDLEPTRKREGVLGMCDGRDYGAYTNAVWGDSGSAITHVPTMKAMGIASRLGVFTTPPTELTGPTIPYILRELAKHPDFGNIHLATIDGLYVGLPEA